MRLLTTKIWRAYPELDRYDDDVCKRYIKRAKRLQNAWKGWALILFAIPVSLMIWLFIFWATTIFHYGLQDQYGWYASDSLLDGFLLTGITGYVWFPTVVCLVIRDRWLHRCVRMQLVGVQCPPCGYSLIGLTINNPDAPSVHCPECGQVTLLSDLGLNEADIDPTRIGEAA